MHRIIRRHVHGAANRLDQRWDRLTFAMRRRFGCLGPALLLPYRKFGTADRLRIGGRVIEDKGALAAARTSSTPRNIWLTYKRWETNEIPGARIRFAFGPDTGEVTTDEEGYFEVEFEPAAPVRQPPGDSWLKIKLDLVSTPNPKQARHSAEAFVLIPPDTARFGMISDIDDTIVKTGATNFLKHWRTIVQNSAEARVAFRGLAPFYRALHRGGGAEGNPIFYISSSPWSLYDLLERYLVLHDIPLGPMMLKDLGLDAGKWVTGGHDAHKLHQIARVLATYPRLPFILVGDSGQRDPSIYVEAVRRHPGRVAAIYIRDVTPDARDAEQRWALAHLQAKNVRLAYGPDLMEAAEDAAAAGFIAAAALAEIRAAIADPDRPGA